MGGKIFKLKFCENFQPEFFALRILLDGKAYSKQVNCWTRRDRLYDYFATLYEPFRTLIQF